MVLSGWPNWVVAWLGGLIVAWLGDLYGWPGWPPFRSVLWTFRLIWPGWWPSWVNFRSRWSVWLGDLNESIYPILIGWLSVLVGWPFKLLTWVSCFRWLWWSDWFTNLIHLVRWSGWLGVTCDCKCTEGVTAGVSTFVVTQTSGVTAGVTGGDLVEWSYNLSGWVARSTSLVT